VSPDVGWALGWNWHALGAAPESSRPGRPMQLEWRNVRLGMLLAYWELKMVGNGQGTPRDLGRAKFLVTTQQVAIAGRANS
jgi:hypothetical protein